MCQVEPSHDPAGVTMVDNVKVFVKSKDSFGCPDDADEPVETPTVKIQAQTATIQTVSDIKSPTVLAPLTPVDR